MTAFDHSTFLQALGWAVLNSLWQMALLWIVFNITVSINRNMRPSQKSSMAASLLFTGFAWFLFTFVSLLINKENNNAIITVNALPAGVNVKLNQWLDTTLPFASIIYIVLLIIPAFRYIRNYRYVQVLRKYNLSKINIDWRIFVKKVSAQIGILKPVQIWVSDLITSPVTIGYLKPIILVPLAAINHLTPQQLEAVLLHELAHIRRYDYLINLLINFIQTILYFNPFVKTFVRTVERERERSCDEMVIQFQYDPHHYASALLMLEKNNVIAAQNMAIAASGKSDLLSRIERILKIEKRNAFSFNKLAGLFAGLLCIILLNAVLIVSKPVTRSGSFAFEQPGSPATLFTSDDDNVAIGNTVLPSKAENKQIVIENHVAPEKKGKKESSFTTDKAALIDPVTPPPFLFTNVALKTPVIPELNKQELFQVKKTVETTKKVVENQQWKELEKSIADALTSNEKQEVKEQYLEELSKVNWNKLESKLKISYDQLNWNKINARLNTAMTTIKLDSLQIVYTIASNALNEAEKMATVSDSTKVEVPMPDVSVEQIKQSREQILKNLNKIKAIRSKKVIHL
ncbi:MAG: M56 family metallopeptidase [Bacteroidota bacterium]